MTKYIGVVVNTAGKVKSHLVSGEVCCPAEVIGWAQKTLNMNDEPGAVVHVFELYGIVERVRSPVTFTPVRGAEPPGNLPEPPDIEKQMEELVNTRKAGY